jgi:hypothetical protein
MNDRIKELAKEANLDYDTHIPDAWSGTADDLEKFAELIIQECYQAVRSRYADLLEDEGMMKDQYWKGYVSGVCDGACEIRLCFDSVDFDH